MELLPYPVIHSFIDFLIENEYGLNMLPNRVIVIGASAGGVESLKKLVHSIPSDLDAAVFVVLHIPSNYVSTLPDILSKSGPLKASHPEDGEEIKSGRIYVAPPDHHLLLEKGHILIARGPKENRHRPSVDALFRSAAYCCGPQTIGIVLSGALDDGTAGLWSIKRLGGTSIIQDPTESAFDSMPVNAMNQVEIDYCLSAADMGPLLGRLSLETVREEPDEAANDKKKMQTEVSVAMEGDAFRKGVMEIGKLTPFTCPECQGVLVMLVEGKINRFRCHTGHAFSTSALLSGVMDKIDQSYWAAIRSLEEAAMLLTDMSGRFAAEGENDASALFRKEAESVDEQAHQLRDTVLKSERFSGDNLFRKATKT